MSNNKQTFIEALNNTPETTPTETTPYTSENIINGTWTPTRQNPRAENRDGFIRLCQGDLEGRPFPYNTIQQP